MNRKFYYGLLIVLIVMYLGTVLFFPANANSLKRYHIDETQLRLLSLAIVVPVFAIYAAAFSSFLNVGKYTDKIKKSPEGAGFLLLLKGLMVLSISLPANALISRLLSYSVQERLVSQATATIITTHLSVVVYLVGFWLLLLGSRRLLATLKNVVVPRRSIIAVATGLVLISALYIILTFINPSRTVVTAPATTATYYMSDWLILLTIVVPYIAAWAFGLYATLHLRYYYENVRGKIYKQALSKLNRGFVIIIFANVILQCLTALGTVISGWALSAILIAVFILFGIIAAGYIYIALGAKKLSKLEDIT